MEQIWNNFSRFTQLCWLSWKQQQLLELAIFFPISCFVLMMWDQRSVRVKPSLAQGLDQQPQVVFWDDRRRHFLLTVEPDQLDEGWEPCLSSLASELLLAHVCFKEREVDPRADLYSDPDWEEIRPRCLRVEATLSPLQYR